MDLEPIDEAARSATSYRGAVSKRRRPRLFGALLDLLAAVWRSCPAFTGRLPRMADFGGCWQRWIVFVRRLCSRPLHGAAGTDRRDGIEGDPVALAIRVTCRRRRLVGRDGSRAAGPDHAGETTEGLAADAARHRRRARSGSLPALKQAGIDVTYRPRRPEGTRRIRARKGGATDVRSSESSELSESENGGSDDGDNLFPDPSNDQDTARRRAGCEGCAPADWTADGLGMADDNPF